MMTRSPATLLDIYGQVSVTALAAAYEETLLTVSGGTAETFPDRDTRALIVGAMLDEGERCGFDTERLRRAASSALWREQLPREHGRVLPWLRSFFRLPSVAQATIVHS